MRDPVPHHTKPCPPSGPGITGYGAGPPISVLTLFLGEVEARGGVSSAHHPWRGVLGEGTACSLMRDGLGVTRAWTRKLRNRGPWFLFFKDGILWTGQ